MSVSQIIANLRAQEQANVDKALSQQQLINELLSALPENTPGTFQVHRGGYCAEAYIVFSPEGDTAESLTRMLYELYPPMECVDLKGNTQGEKPLKYLRPEDRYESQRPIFPVLVKSTRTEQSARWWTTLTGRDVEIQVKGGSLAHFTDILAGRYVPDSHGYAGGAVSFWTRALAEPVVRPGAMVAWLHAWAEFAKVNNFSSDGVKFMETVGKRLAKRAPGLAPPEMLSATGEEAAHIRWPGCSAKDPFREFFTAGEQAAIDAFAKEQHAKLGIAREQQAEDFAVVRKWFEDFFGRFGFLYTNDGDMSERISHSLRKNTGLDVRVQMMNPGRTSVSLSVFFKGWEEYPSYYVPFSQEPNPSRVKAQDIDVEYVA
jgi:hypothetical protein